MSEADGRRNRAALEGLFALNMPQLYRAATRLLQNPEDSEDALQDAMLSAFLHLDQFQGRSRMSTWMYTIVSNAARKQLRGRKHMQITSIADDATDHEMEDARCVQKVLVDSRPNPEEACTWEERSRILKERVKYLPLNYRCVIQMCIIDDLPRREAAHKLGVSVGTVKARLHRACTLLVKER